MIQDSGDRRVFSTGAVRDMAEGKGRFDLVPWEAIWELAKHCEAGAKKYGERNCEKGIPVHSLIDSAIRHLAKYLMGWKDEPHLRAALWNVAFAIYMEQKHPEMQDIPTRQTTPVTTITVPDNDMGKVSDGYHTFDDLYTQRLILTAVIVRDHPDICWKSWKHNDGEECFGGKYFIVGVDTPMGSYTYHYERKYWGLFECRELELGKPWDGHTSEDVNRLLSICPASPKSHEEGVS